MYLSATSAWCVCFREREAPAKQKNGARDFSTLLSTYFNTPMRKLNISDTGARGWFVGDFPEAALNTKSCEVCYRENVTGDFDTHYHTVCTEVILVVKGRVLMNDMIMTAGDIVVLEPGE